MAKKNFQHYICRPFCSFFREGEKEDMLCGGARAVERLVQRGILRQYMLPDGLPVTGSSAERDTALEKVVCGNCPFFGEDCDFQAKPVLPNAEPCGGYILLQLLMQQGTISINDVEETVDD